jgi:hypothetical protein
MSPKQRLLQVIEQAPDQVIEFLLHLLDLSEVQTPAPETSPTLDSNPFKIMDGVMVLPGQNPLPSVDWVSLIREERLITLMSNENSF